MTENPKPNNNPVDPAQWDDDDPSKAPALEAQSAEFKRRALTSRQALEAIRVAYEQGDFDTVEEQLRLFTAGGRGPVRRPPSLTSAAAVAWHAIQYTDEACTKPQCTGCLSPGDDACPVMAVVKATPCPFPDDPSPPKTSP